MWYNFRPMLLTITTTHQPATDLGFLLHKNPAHCQSFDLFFGKVHIFYPEATAERCTAALLLDVDPIGLVRGRQAADFSLGHYVNDRAYVASSFMSTAIAQVYGTALNGRSRDRPELAATPIPLKATVAVLPGRGGPHMLRDLFEPLGYAVHIERHALDTHFPEWGESRYYTLTLEAEIRLSELLSHLYVLIPVLDDDKHYYVGQDEIDKLLKRGEGWLAQHPAYELITNRYLRHQRSLTRKALAQLLDETETAAPETDPDEEEAAVERPISLHTQRLDRVTAVLKESGVCRVLDLGCGEGRLLKRLLADRQFTEIVGVDISYDSLEKAARRLKLDRLLTEKRERITLLHGSLSYRDGRLKGYDAAVLVEVVEHLDPFRLPALERVVFEFAAPRLVIRTTPNVEYNVRFESLPVGKFRHRDHRFEWGRAEFEAWATAAAERNGYTVTFEPIGPVDEEVGAPSQMAMFEQK
jgi:3' terminal RNA ribose 2'-O-methyltransferase Hen1